MPWPRGTQCSGVAIARYILLAGFALLLVAAIVVVLTGERLGVGLVAVALLLASVGLAGRVFTVRVALPPAEPPKRAVVIWNPKSGGGKAVSNNLADEARARGIEPIELKPGDDLEQLVRDAVAAGADGLAAAGGDGTQALVASIAAEHDLPFACIPAGTRNHFALDLGVDRDDVVGALDAFVTGGEHRVDLAEINGRVFVNNVSLGLYAEAVQREGYRDAKLRTMLDTMPDVLGSQPDRRDERPGLAWPRRHRAPSGGGDPDLEQRLPLGSRRIRAPGRASTAASSGSPSGRRPTTEARRWQQWSAPDVEITSTQPVPVGVDGEALVLDPPLRFVIRPAVLRVRIAPQHPGASPTAALPGSFTTSSGSCSPSRSDAPPPDERRPCRPGQALARAHER